MKKITFDTYVNYLTKMTVRTREDSFAGLLVQEGFTPEEAFFLSKGVTPNHEITLDQFKKWNQLMKPQQEMVAGKIKPSLQTTSGFVRLSEEEILKHYSVKFVSGENLNLTRLELTADLLANGYPERVFPMKNLGVLGLQDPEEVEKVLKSLKQTKLPEGVFEVV